MRTRILLGAGGGVLGLFGVFRLLTQIPGDDLVVLFVWLAGALVIHDGILSPLVIGLGALFVRYVPARPRAYLQGALVTAGAVTVIALPLIHREGSQPAVKAILRQNYAANLGVLLGLIALGAVLLYGLRAVRDAQRASSANERPSADQSSSTS